MRLAAPDYVDVSVLANIGGRPLGLTFDAEQRIVTCVSGMGLVRVNLDGDVELLTDQTERSLSPSRTTRRSGWPTISISRLTARSIY